MTYGCETRDTKKAVRERVKLRVKGKRKVNELWQFELEQMSSFLS
jgi:hypothetical protein